MMSLIAKGGDTQKRANRKPGNASTVTLVLPEGAAAPVATSPRASGGGLAARTITQTRRTTDLGNHLVGRLAVSDVFFQACVNPTGANALNTLHT